MNHFHNKHGPDYDVGPLFTGRARDGTSRKPHDGPQERPRDGTFRKARDKPVEIPRQATYRKPRDKPSEIPRDATFRKPRDKPAELTRDETIRKPRDRPLAVPRDDITRKPRDKTLLLEDTFLKLLFSRLNKPQKDVRTYSIHSSNWRRSRKGKPAVGLVMGEVCLEEKREKKIENRLWITEYEEREPSI